MEAVVSTPVFVLGCHRSGTSVVAGLLHDACGVRMGELMPPTGDNPLGYFEAQGVVDAHRSLLYQMERDWTCPPTRFRADLLDLEELREQVAQHQTLDGVWAVKDPRLMFLLSAWATLGVTHARLVGVVRAPADTARSIAERDGIRPDRAEAIVDAYLRRLAEIASATALPVIRFSDDGDHVLAQVRDVAGALDLPWDGDVARSFFDPDLVRNRTHPTTTPAYDLVLERASTLDAVPATDLTELELCSEPEWPLETHLGVRYSLQRNELWEQVRFRTTDDPEVVELVLEGARLRNVRRPGASRLQVLEVAGPEFVASTLTRHRTRPNFVIANGLLAGRSAGEAREFFRATGATTQLSAEMLIDAPEPSGGVLHVEPSPPTEPSPAQLVEIADSCGWEHRSTEPLSPGRVAMTFRKREAPPQLSAAHAADLDRLHVAEAELADARRELESLRCQPPVERERRRADRAERELRRLRSRRSVRLALALARAFRAPIRKLRAWTSAR